MELLLIVILAVLLLFVTYREHLELKDKNFPFAYYPCYVNDLEVAGVRLLKSEDIALRVPKHEVDMRNQFMVRDNKSNIVFDMTQ
jgi:hypothetical protein